jgi:hypothetical protein
MEDLRKKKIQNTAFMSHLLFKKHANLLVRAMNTFRVFICFEYIYCIHMLLISISRPQARHQQPQHQVVHQPFEQFETKRPKGIGCNTR